MAWPLFAKRHFRLRLMTGKRRLRRLKDAPPGPSQKTALSFGSRRSGGQAGGCRTAELAVSEVSTRLCKANTDHRRSERLELWRPHAGGRLRRLGDGGSGRRRRARHRWTFRVGPGDPGERCGSPGARGNGGPWASSISAGRPLTVPSGRSPASNARQGASIPAQSAAMKSRLSIDLALIQTLRRVRCTADEGRYKAAKYCRISDRTGSAQNTRRHGCSRRSGSAEPRQKLLRPLEACRRSSRQRTLRRHSSTAGGSGGGSAGDGAGEPERGRADDAERAGELRRASDEQPDCESARKRAARSRPRCMPRAGASRPAQPKPALSCTQ